MPTPAVPWLWNQNSTTRITIVIGTTYGSSTGVATPRPSTAPSTEMAGVMMPSPYSSAAPKIPRAISQPRSLLPVGLIGVASAVRARMPPSPWLSARSTNTRYFTDITMMSAQTISDSTPRT